MKVLFLTTESEDYLADTLLHGLRGLTELEVIDYPKKNSLYNSLSNTTDTLYGRGFTLYGLLREDEIDRKNVYKKLAERWYDLIIFSSIHHQFGLYIQLLPYLDYKNTIILDGEDNESIYPFYGKFWRYKPYWFLPKAHNRFLYFKREYTPASIKSVYYNLLPYFLLNFIKPPSNLRPTSFSIPEEKIIARLPLKTKLFPKHIVDIEIAKKIGASTSYAFSNETQYYQDLQESKFGITTKRAGWDCLRHYEVAANGAVPCFKNLDKKPATCAPHGLNQSNCITYKDYNDLVSKIEALSESEYLNLQQNAWNWAKNNTTKIQAEQVLKEVSKITHKF